MKIKLAKIIDNDGVKQTITYNPLDRRLYYNINQLLSDKVFNDIEQAYQEVCAMYNNSTKNIWDFEDYYSEIGE